MNNIFSQPKIIHKIHFITNYKSINIFEEFFPEDIPGISTYEVESKTIESEDNDLWSFEAYFTEEPNFLKVKNDLIEYANKNKLFINSDITHVKIEDKDWVAEYQKQLKPIEIGRFIITSTSQNLESYNNKTPIFIEASRAFGTGDHATTSLCIQEMERIQKNDIKTIFDIGTGTGILSFAAEKIWSQSSILACDIEEISVKIATENLIHNNSKVRFYQNTEESLIIPSNNPKKFDLIISNILSKPLIFLAPEFKSLSQKGTKIILSGFLDYQRQDVQKTYEDIGFTVENISQMDRWIALTLSF